MAIDYLLTCRKRSAYMLMDGKQPSVLENKSFEFQEKTDTLHFSTTLVKKPQMQRTDHKLLFINERCSITTKVFIVTLIEDFQWVVLKTFEFDYSDEPDEYRSFETLSIFSFRCGKPNSNGGSRSIFCLWKTWTDTLMVLIQQLIWSNLADFLQKIKPPDTIRLVTPIDFPIEGIVLEDFSWMMGKN